MDLNGIYEKINFNSAYKLNNFNDGVFAKNRNLTFG